MNKYEVWDKLIRKIQLNRITFFVFTIEKSCIYD